MLQYLIFALVSDVMQAVVTGVHAGLLLSQSGQESRTSLAQDQGLQISLKAPLGNTEVKSTVENVVYSLSGPGADQPPTGLFLIDKKSGEVIVTKALDREQQAKYTLTARATSEDAKEEYELIINVIDQNDNKPVFQQDTFLGSVNETTPVGYEFMTVVATDADEPGSGNSDIRYAIQSQDPPLPSDAFSINDVTGGIMLNSTSFDTKNISNYTLIILAADMEGNGLSALTKAIVTLTDSNDEGPQDDKDKTADPVVI
ncbi:cadherin-4-like isoform X3 [Engraulis encrasicolus]|uniref:cadherin-4-like isoform X3 n=1 Tax=Engraulis encrasicolus TaxID=184585 RepID=UPI002FD4A70B